MEAALELEDDAFFKDLSKQISLLIMDDDDEVPFSHYPSLNLKAFTQAIHPTKQVSLVNYDQQTSKREIKGTGVFIPRSTNQRKTSVKKGRFISSGNKPQRSCDHNSRGLPHMAYSNHMICPSYDHSFNITRF